MPRFAWAILFAASAAFGAPAVEPSPALSPRDVVEAQLAALRANDDPDPDAGIRTAFRFASPENRKSTGPIERFVEMVKNPHYAPLLNHRTAHLSETTEKDNMARIKVTVIAADGKEAAFVWILERVRTGECAGCWMTSTVMRVDVKNSPFRVAGVGYWSGGWSSVIPALMAARSASVRSWCSFRSRAASSARPRRA